MKCFIVLLALVAVASAGGYHHAQYIHVAEPAPVPDLKAQPLALHGNDHTTRIHYSGGHVGHPHLVGVDQYHAAPHYEPGISNVAVHGHGYGGHGHY